MTLKNTILALFSTVLFISCSSDSSTDDLNLEENLTITQEIHKLVNEYRVSKGKATVEFNNRRGKNFIYKPLLGNRPPALDYRK